MLKKHKGELRKIVTDKLRSYGVAPGELIPDSCHDTFTPPGFRSLMKVTMNEQFNKFKHIDFLSFDLTLDSLFFFLRY